MNNLNENVNEIIANDYESYQNSDLQEINQSEIKPNIGKKILEICEDVCYIKKNGKNTFQHYTYVTEADIVSRIRRSMIKHKLLITPTILDKKTINYITRKEKRAFLVSVKVKMTFTDVESGESFFTIGYGEGSDADDKGVYKAITGAQKYILMKTFMIETGDDPEKEAVENAKINYENKKLTEKQLNQAISIASQGNLEKYEKVKQKLENYIVSENQKETIEKAYNIAIQKINNELDEQAKKEE